MTKYLFLFFILIGCSTTQIRLQTPPRAMAKMINAQGEELGQVSFEKAAEGLMVSVELAKLPPKKTLAMHVHETGLCDPPDFKSAGGHFNPHQKEHGASNPKGAHAGDLPNIKTQKDGTVRFETITSALSLDPTKTNSIITQDGTSLVIHLEADDEKTDPSGNSGARLLCGVIQGERPSK